MILTGAAAKLVPDGYLSELLFPFIPVVQSSGKLAKYGNAHLRIENSVKAGQGAYRRVVPIARSTQTYQVEGHGLEGLVTADDYRNVLLPFKAENDVMEGLVSMLWVEKEVVLSTMLASTSIITQNTTLAGATQFSDYNNSDPISIFAAARLAVKNGCGKRPDTCFMDWRTYDVLRYHPQLLDAMGFKYAKPGGLSPEDLAVALNVKRVLIADVDYETANEGQSSSLGAAWGKHIWFGVLPEKAEVGQVSAGYRIGYEGKSPRQIYKYALNNPPDSTGILSEDNYDYLLSNAGAIYLIKNAIA